MVAWSLLWYLWFIAWIAILIFTIGDWKRAALVVTVSAAALAGNRLAWRAGGFKRTRFERRYGRLSD